MTRFKGGLPRVGAELFKDVVLPLADGLVATDGVQYTAVATFGTTAVQVYNALIDPGYTIALKKLEVGLTQMFTGLNGSFVASIIYHWQANHEYVTPDGTLVTGAAINITGTYQKAVGTLTTSEDTFSGYVPVASLPYAPVRVILTAIGPDRAAVCQGKVKNSSYIRMVGNIIPGA